MIPLLLGSALAAPCGTVPNSSQIMEIQVSQISDLVQQQKGCWAVLELWALWCPPCIQLKPELNKLRKKHSDVRFLSISADTDQGKLSKYLKANPAQALQFRLSQWSTKTLAEEFEEIGAEFSSAIPYFVVLKPDGSVAAELTEPKSLEEITSFFAPSKLLLQQQQQLLPAEHKSSQ